MPPRIQPLNHTAPVPMITATSAKTTSSTTSCSERFMTAV